MRVLRALQLIAIAMAAAVALYPPPQAWVGRVYAGGWYPALQATLTGASNRTSVALFDVTMAAALVVLAAGGLWCGRHARRGAWARPIIGAAAAAAATLVTLLAVTYLWFAVVWGTNYQRPAIEGLIGFEPSRVTAGAVQRLAERAVDEANRGHAPAHAAGFAAIDAVPPALVHGLHQVERSLGRPRPTVPARPKWSMLTPFFRASSVSGMLAPFFLETLLNPDLTGPERPVVLAHEWAHLSGYAPEADASFVGVLAALQADAPAQYSAWLFVLSECAAQLDVPVRTVVFANLGAGPRSDLNAIAQRLRGRVAAVERVSWAAYDQMLKSQGVAEGIESYSRVVQLLVGSGALEARR